MTLRLQIAATLGLLAALAAAIAALFSYTSVDERLTTETDNFLDERVALVLSFIDSRANFADGDALLPRIAAQDSTGTTAIARFDAEIRFLLPDGSVVAATSDAVLSTTQDELDRVLQSTDTIRARVEINGRTYETRLVAFDAPAGQRAVLQVGRDVTDQVETLAQLRLRLLLLVATVVIVGAGAGLFLASRLVKPLDNLRAATRDVAETKDFSTTISVEGTGEIADVAGDFNLMLAKLNESILQQRRLVQDASHELRTPLSTLRANVELSQRMAVRSHTPDGTPTESEPEHIALLSSALGEVDELSRLVDELVNLASFPFDETPIEILDLAELTNDAVDAFRSLHPRRPISVYVGANLPISGTRPHLTRAVTNVLANAHKFAPADTALDVAVADNYISVSDRGPGIAEADLARIFDRFYRSPTVQTIEGSGLGLAFVAEVIDWHGGTVNATNRVGGGASITLEIPPAP